MQQITLRLKSGQFLKEEIEKAAVERHIKAGVVLSMVGAVENAVLRMAGSTVDNQVIKKWDKRLEIVSGTGTISAEGCHLHVSFSDEEGDVIGGHLKDGCKVWLTTEVVLGVFNDVTYKRVFDEDTGFKELSAE